MEDGFEDRIDKECLAYVERIEPKRKDAEKFAKRYQWLKWAIALPLACIGAASAAGFLGQAYVAGALALAGGVLTAVESRLKPGQGETEQWARVGEWEDLRGKFSGLTVRRGTVPAEERMDEMETLKNQFAAKAGLRVRQDP